jgi:hypothetical protein
MRVAKGREELQEFCGETVGRIPDSGNWIGFHHRFFRHFRTTVG